MEAANPAAWSVGLVGPDGVDALQQMTQRDAGKRRRPITPTPPQPQPGSRKCKPPRQFSEPGAVGPTPSTSEAFRSISEYFKGLETNTVELCRFFASSLGFQAATMIVWAAGIKLSVSPTVCQSLRRALSGLCR